MKNKIHLFRALLIMALTNLLISSSIFAQPPQKMSYQCVVRDHTGALVTNKSIGVRTLILVGSPIQIIVFEETYLSNPATNKNGLLTLEIGSGKAQTGSFTSINWSSGTYFLVTEIDPTGGTNFTITGQSQILSVPYALYSEKAGSFAETDPLWTGVSTNYYTKAELQTSGSSEVHFVNLKARPTTLAGYGITNGVSTSGNQTIGGNKTFTGITTVPTPVNATDAATKAYVDALLIQIRQLENQPGIVKDCDGNLYTTVKIGAQVWMGENLKTTSYNDGTAIPLVTDNTAWINLTTPGYCWYFNDAATYKNLYGALYNWYAVSATTNGGKNVCPAGWHVPTDAEWTTMGNYLIANGYNYDGTTTGNKYAKSLASTANWTVSGIAGAVGNTDYPAKRNVTGFTALPGGFRDFGGIFGIIGSYGSWWSSTEGDATDAWGRYLYCDNGSVDRIGSDEVYGFSVRCVRD